MAMNDLNNNENILVKVDQNNLIFIDPNSVVSDGVVEPRGTNPENLVYYVNLEADLVPRTTLNSSNNGGGTLTSIAKGTLNLLENKGKEYLDTSWTDLYTDQPRRNEGGRYVRNTDQSGQSFGMSSVDVVVKGANFVPYVNITFIDVRGKTLFDSPPESPYSAFFHIPWPIFYLTVKGFYGKAIRYRLHLISFNTAYNDSNGNFESTAKFVGSTYAYLNDISLTSVLNAPYMYGIEIPTQEQTNEGDGTTKVKLSKSSRGYQTMISVYDEYRRKGLITIPEGVNPTLRDVIAKAERLDQVLEKEIFGDNGIVDMKLFGLVKEFDDLLVKFDGVVKQWGTRYTTKEYKLVNDIEHYYLNKGENNKTTHIIGETTGTLESILKAKSGEIKRLQQSIRELLKEKGNKKYNDFNVNIKNPIDDISLYYKNVGNTYGVATGLITEHIFEIINSFNQEKKKLQDKVEERMNEVIKGNGVNGLGFEPTIRNIFGVLLAGADTFIRLMNNIHFKAYNVREERSKLLEGFSDETTQEGAIYPWPEVKKVTSDNSKILAYPADLDLVRKLNSDDSSLWPEVEFVEEFITVSQQISDNLSEKERTFDKVTFEFANSDSEKINIKKVSTSFISTDVTPYTDKSFDSILYEILERSRYSTLYDSYDIETTLNELANLEFETFKERIKEDYFIVDVMREVTSISKLQEYLQGFSPFERYPYFIDGTPTVEYIQELNVVSHQLTDFDPTNVDGTTDSSGEYPKLSEDLLNYEVEEYRQNIYPFNSDTYLGYRFKTKVTKDDMNVKKTFVVDTTKGFVSTPVMTSTWVMSGSTENMFSNGSYYSVPNEFELPLFFGGVSTQLNLTHSKHSLLNTPFFHRTLNEDFYNTNSLGKYKSSAYLLLNSLPFKDLDQTINFGNSNITMSNLFKEIGSSHYIPYHLILKWGSIYHRYKTQILEGIDIMDNVMDPISGSEFFDNNQNLTLNGVNRTNQTDIGFHPHYSSIYHQVINGYLYYDISDTTNTSFETAITNDVVQINSFTKTGINYYTSFVDNSKFDPEDQRYTILPSHGPKQRAEYGTYDISEQYNFISDWTDDAGSVSNEFSYSGMTFPSHNEYLTKNVGNLSNQEIRVESDNKKIIDLIATFSPQILNDFEEAFLNFASEKVNTYQTIKQYETVAYDKFQDLLKELVTVEKKGDDDLENLTTTINKISERQLEQQKSLTKDLLSGRNLIKLTIGNPKELDLNILKTYTNGTFSGGEYNSSQLVSNSKFIDLYIGEDIDGFYSEFFSMSNIEVNEENILLFRSVLHIYGGFRVNGGVANKGQFITYLIENIILPHTNRESMFLSILLSKMSGLERTQDMNNNLGVTRSYGQDPIKLETYNNFKLFNDRWTAGNSIGQRLIMEEFLFLDKANKDIGDDLFFDVKKLIPLGLPTSQNLRLFNAISQMLSRNNLDLRPLPAYINFYGNETRKTKIKTSSNVASLLFGKFLDVDVEYSTPKMIVQYVGRPSAHIDTNTISKNYKFKNDTANVDSSINNPLLITDPNYFDNIDVKKSNKVVAFEVSFGDQNQGLFKSISLDQTQFKSTFESNVAIENAARSESGAGISQVDTQLYDIYKTRSYTCEVTMMGNVMVQPTMYFQLKNVPLFEGAYWIIEVSHGIKNNTIETRFKGVRIPKDSLPNPKDSFTASYRILYDKIMNSALKKIASEKKLTTSEIITTKNGTFKTDRGGVIIEGEELLKESGVQLAVPYNGYNDSQTIQKVKYKGKTWYRSIVSSFNGPTNVNLALPVLLSKEMVVRPSTVPFTEINENSNYFYRLDFDANSLLKPINDVKSVAEFLLRYGKTDFLNPINGKTKTIVSNVKLIDEPVSPFDEKRFIEGPADIGKSSFVSDEKTIESGISLSKKLMKDLRLQEGQVVYFNIR